MKFFNRMRKPPSEEKKKVLDDKTLLKLARQYIDEKNMNEAIKCCKKVLRKNNQNYLALVLLGKSLEGSEDAPINFEKAIRVKPDHPLAWQGLAKYYEGKSEPAAKAKLLNIYNKLVTLPIEEDYAIKTLEKHGQLSCLLKKSDSVTTILKFINGKSNEKLLQTAKKQLLLLLESEVPCKKEDMNSAILILKSRNENVVHDDTSQIVLAKLILQNTDFGSAVKEIIGLESFSEKIALREWLCEFICKVFVKNDSFCGFEIDNYVHDLTEGIEDKKYVTVLIAAMHYRQGEFKEAYQQCSFAVSKANEIDMTEGLLMLNCTKELKNVALLEHLSMFLSKTLKLKTPQILSIVYKSLLSTYVEQKRCYEAVSVLKQISIEKLDSNVLIEISHLYIASAVHAGVVMNILDATKYQDLFRALTYIKKVKYAKAVLTLRLYDKHPIKYYIMGFLFYTVRLYDECLYSLYRANELIPNNSKVNYYFGLYYYTQERDIDESKRYFEIAYSICATDIDIIKMLSFIYDKLERIDLEYQLLLNVLRTTAITEFWIYTRLGRLCYARGDINESIVYLQEGINLNPEDITAYEWIGDAYFRLKTYDEALLAYEKVVELSFNTPVLIYSLNKIGTIYSIKKKHHEAIFMFEGILNIDPDNVVALRGISENKLITANKSVSIKLFYTAREEIQGAITYVTKAMTKNLRDDIYWHLISDMILFITRLPNQHCHVKLHTIHGIIVLRCRIPMYETIIHSLTTLAKLKDDLALFKCSVSYLEYYNLTKQDTLWKISYNMAVLCVTIKPNSWRYWDLLGKICYIKEKYAVAHHCFFSALRLSSPSHRSMCKVWCNLGLLYLKLDKNRISQYCFSIGQSALPAYPTEWIGDGMLAQIIAEDGHVGLFTPDPNSTFEFTEDDFLEWANLREELTIPLNEPAFDSPIESFSHVPHKTDLLQWYLSFMQDNVYGCYLLGCIYEKRGLLSFALSQYEKATRMTGDNDSLRRTFLLDRARVLLHMHRYNVAVRVFLGVEVFNAETVCALASALFEAKHFPETYIAYNVAMSQFSHQINNDNQVKILIIMANVAHEIQDSTFAATVLDRAIEINAPSLGGTFSFIKSYLLTKIKFEVVATFMEERQQNHINENLWWYYRGLNYLRGPKRFAKNASRCIKRAINLALNTEHSGEIGKMHAMVSIAEFYSDDRTTATEYAQQALTVYPGQAELWAALILCVFSHRDWPDRESWIFRALYAVRNNISLSRSIRQWLRSLEEKLIRLE